MRWEEKSQEKMTSEDEKRWDKISHQERKGIREMMRRQENRHVETKKQQKKWWRGEQKKQVRWEVMRRIEQIKGDQTETDTKRWDKRIWEMREKNRWNDKNGKWRREEKWVKCRDMKRRDDGRTAEMKREEKRWQIKNKNRWEEKRKEKIRLKQTDWTLTEKAENEMRWHQERKELRWEEK